MFLAKYSTLDLTYVLLEQSVVCSRASTGLPGSHQFGGWDSGEDKSSWLLGFLSIRVVTMEENYLGAALILGLQANIFQRWVNSVDNQAFFSPSNFYLNSSQLATDVTWNLPGLVCGLRIRTIGYLVGDKSVALRHQAAFPRSTSDQIASSEFDPYQYCNWQNVLQLKPQ